MGVGGTGGREFGGVKENGTTKPGHNHSTVSL